MLSRPTIGELIEEVKKLAKKSPNNKYRKNGPYCDYFDGTCTDGSKGCIFGQAFILLKTLPYEGNAPIQTILEFMGFEGYQYEIAWCIAVQKSQDSGNTWSTSILNASHYTNYKD